MPIYLFYLFIVNEEAGESWRYNLRVCNFFFTSLIIYSLYIASHQMRTLNSDSTVFRNLSSHLTIVLLTKTAQTESVQLLLI